MSNSLLSNCGFGVEVNFGFGILNIMLQISFVVGKQLMLHRR